MILFAFAGIVLAFFTYLIIPEMKSPHQTSVMSDIREVIFNKRVVWTCIFAGLMVGPLEGFADVWGTTFLKQVYGFDASMAASLPSMIFVGICFGSPLLNFIAEKIENYSLTIIGSGIIMTIVFISLLIWQLSPEVLTFSFIITGVCSAYQILAIYKASTYVSENVAGLTTAVANMIIMIFGYVFHTIIGIVINMAGGVNSLKAIELGMAVIPIGLCIGTVGFMFCLLPDKKQTA